MKPHALQWTLRCTAIALACLLASGCKDRQEPVKPIAPWLLSAFVDR